MVSPIASRGAAVAGRRPGRADEPTTISLS